MSYEDMKPLAWESAIIKCFIGPDKKLTPKDIVKWLNYTERTLGSTDISSMAKKSQDIFKRDLKATLRLAEHHKRSRLYPFVGTQRKAKLPKE